MEVFKMSKAFKKWKDLIDSKRETNQPWKESEIIYFRKAIGPSGLKDKNQRDELRDYFEECMPSDGYNITSEQKEKGITYLLENSYKKNGSLRKNNIFGSFELEIIKNFCDFKFVGLYSQLTLGGFDMGYTVPIYRCISKDGSYFDYTGCAYSMIKVLYHSKRRLELVK